MVRIFPNEASLVRLLTALTIQSNEQWMERRYLTMTEDTHERSGTPPEPFTLSEENRNYRTFCT